MRFDFHSTLLSGLYCIDTKPIIDERGYFERLFCEEDFQKIGLKKKIVQINHSFTKMKGSIRGMHFQYPPYCETKIIRCTKGSVFDVAVDIRKGSKTFLQWHGEILTAGNMKMLLIPEGFAHGFQSQTDECEMLYFHTNFYNVESEVRLYVKDPRIGIKWPLDITNLSEMDQNNTIHMESFRGIEL